MAFKPLILSIANVAVLALTLSACSEEKEAPTAPETLQIIPEENATMESATLTKSETKELKRVKEAHKAFAADGLEGEALEGYYMESGETNDGKAVAYELRAPELDKAGLAGWGWAAEGGFTILRQVEEKQANQAALREFKELITQIDEAGPFTGKGFHINAVAAGEETIIVPKDKAAFEFEKDGVTEQFLLSKGWEVRSTGFGDSNEGTVDEETYAWNFEMEIGHELYRYDDATGKLTVIKSYSVQE